MKTIFFNENYIEDNFVIENYDEDTFVDENEEKEGWKVIDWIGRHWTTSTLDKQTNKQEATVWSQNIQIT